MAILLGVHDNTLDSAARAVEYEGHAMTREFVGGVRVQPIDLVEKLEKMCAPAWQHGHVAVWSFKPHPASVANGAWRDRVEQLGRHLRQHRRRKPTVVIVWHEPESEIGKHFAAPEDFVSLFNTVHHWLAWEYPRVVTCHAAQGYAYRDSGPMDDATARRWRTRATIHGIDIYSGRSFPLQTILPELSGFARWKRRVVAGRRWAVTERGWTCTPANSAKRAATIAREFAWLAGLRRTPAGYIVWSTHGTEKDAGLVLDAAARQAVTQGFRTLQARAPIGIPW